MSTKSQPQMSTDEKVSRILEVAEEANIRQQVEARLIDATNTANNALNQINNHEKICELRYQAIAAGVTDVKTALAEIKEAMLKSSAKTDEKSDSMLSRANIALGCWVGTIGLGTVFGIVYTLQQLGAK